MIIVGAMDIAEFNLAKVDLHSRGGVGVVRLGSWDSSFGIGICNVSSVFVLGLRTDKMVSAKRVAASSAYCPTFVRTEAFRLLF